LRLQLGHNPNSSSIGTIVFAMPAALIGLTVAFGAAAGLLSAALLHRKDEAPERTDTASAQPRGPRTASKP